MYKLKKQVQSQSDDEDLFVLASADYENGAIVIANASNEDKEIEIEVENPFHKKWKVSKTTATEDDATAEVIAENKLTITVPARAIALIEN